MESTTLTALLDQDAMGRLTGVDPRTYAAWRLRRQGPPYIRVGRCIRYNPEDVGAWLKARTVTAEPHGQGGNP